MSEPSSASHKRPNNKPYYIKQNCDKCGTELVYADLLSDSHSPVEEIWYDEFMCPLCRDGVYMDWQKNY